MESIELQKTNKVDNVLISYFPATMRRIVVCLYGNLTIDHITFMAVSPIAGTQTNPGCCQPVHMHMKDYLHLNYLRVLFLFDP